MAYSLVLTFSLLFATFSSLLEEAASLNQIDACRRKNANWATNRQALAHCAVGYGKNAMGGKGGAIYVVTSPADDLNPKPGTLRYGVSQAKPLWITFARDMNIALKGELLVKSYKTIDGRGANVVIGNGPCIVIHRANHVIIHGLTIHSCRLKQRVDGDAIRLFQSTHVWIDHCHLSRCQDGLVDVVLSSTAVTISNNFFTQHDKAVLLGHADNYAGDKIMRVTIAFNRFGPGLTQRMPRVRQGYAHVANNMYDKWGEYAIGGSAHPTIFSEGNYFVAPNDRVRKQVTKKMAAGVDGKTWKIGSSTKDVFMNGAYFGLTGGVVAPAYKFGESFQVAHGSQVPSLTSSAGVLRCVAGKAC